MTQQSPVPTPHNESYTDTDGPRMNVESFNLDHTKVAAPFIRVADRKHLPGGDELVKYDVRFTQPNVDHLDMKAVHSIEHLTAELMRNHTDRLIDWGPMGCQTGFYALTLGIEPEEFVPLLETTFRDILEATEVPAANKVQCGWGANHCLTAAQDAVRAFLDAREEWDQVLA
ncbi:S-ribosylhomocysteine lyase [Actinomyces urogenitalis]|uniref:S-ribosylhomocysteine lyase n=1 Tax=Actinomyces urogenitalis TaxID=103621 RepID=UPI000AF0DAF1